MTFDSGDYCTYTCYDHEAHLVYHGKSSKSHCVCDDNGCAFNYNELLGCRAAVCLLTMDDILLEFEKGFEHAVNTSIRNLVFKFR